MAAIAAAFGLGTIERWAEIPAGTINSNFSVETERGRFCVRINEGKGEPEVRYEVELIAALTARGVPAPVPIRTASGEPFVLHAGQLVSAFPWVYGSHREAGEVTPGDARAVGAALARLHLAGREIAAQHERSGIYGFDQLCERVMAVRAVVNMTSDPVLLGPLAALEDEIAWLRARAAIRAQAPRGLIHGDLFRDNVFFSGDELTALIDFEQASTGSLTYDLAVCLNAWCFVDDFDGALVGALVSGYEDVRALEPEDREALPIEVRAAAMRFTITRITDVYLAGVDSPSKDFRRFLMRLERWRELGREGLWSFITVGRARRAGK